MTTTGPRPERFSRAHRLRTAGEFRYVYGTRHRRESGPLLVYAAANDLGHPRLGLSVSRKVGGAVRRNRVKRCLREAFRKLKVELDQPFDYVVVVRPHRPLTPDGYAQHLDSLMRRLPDSWRDRSK